MTLVPTLDEQLGAAAERLARERIAADRRSRRKWLLPSFAVGGLAIAGSAVAAALWQPQLGHPGSTTSTSESTVPAEQTAMLAVLRSPQTDADRGPETLRALKALDPLLPGIRLSAVRLLGTDAAGDGFVLVSAERELRETAEGTQTAIDDPLCVMANDLRSDQNERVGTGVKCWSTQAVADRRAYLGSMGLPTSDGRFAYSQVYGLAPDGVTQVRVTIGDDSQIADVHRNFFFVRFDHIGRETPQITWLP